MRLAAIAQVPTPEPMNDTQHRCCDLMDVLSPRPSLVLPPESLPHHANLRKRSGNVMCARWPDQRIPRCSLVGIRLNCKNVTRRTRRQLSRRRWQRPGKTRTEVTPSRSSISAWHTASGRACRRTTRKRWCGIAKRRTKATLPRDVANKKASLSIEGERFDHERTMSAKARSAISAAQKARWAKQKAAAKKQ